MSEPIDVHSYSSSDPHTAIPDWLPFVAGIGPEARNLIAASLVLEKRHGAPTRRQLAQALGVDERSIYRWLREIAKAGALSIRRDKRRRINVFHKPKPDRPITDRPITDRPITDRPIRFGKNDSSEHVSQQSHEAAIPDQAISDRSQSGWLVGESSPKKDPQSTKPTRRKLVTPLAKWLRHAGMVGAHLFDDPALDYSTYKNDFERKRAEGMLIGRIVEIWRSAPLERIELESDECDLPPTDIPDNSAIEHRDDLADPDVVEALKEQHEAMWQQQIRQEIIDRVNPKPQTYR